MARPIFSRSMPPTSSTSRLPHGRRRSFWARGRRRPTTWRLRRTISTGTAVSTSRSEPGGLVRIPARCSGSGRMRRARRRRGKCSPFPRSRRYIASDGRTSMAIESPNSSSRRFTERVRKDRIGTVPPRDCSSSGHPPTRERIRGRWKWPARPTTSSTTS